MKTSFLVDCYPNIEIGLLEEIETHSFLKTFGPETFVVKQGEQIRYLPIVKEGCVKVFCNEENIDFLLYYLEPGFPCAQSFAHIADDKPTEFSAIVEKRSVLLLLPIAYVKLWIKTYPMFNNMILASYVKHYNELLSATKQIICYNLEDRLINFLIKRSKIEKSNTIKISHKNIAGNLGTSREVITRLMKKLSVNKKLRQEGRAIKLL